VPNINTACDLYSAILQLVAQHERTERPLEEYLRALWNVGHHFRERPSLTPDEFFGVLAEAFVAEPQSLSPDFQSAVSEGVHALDLAEVPGFQGWEYCVVRQIVDLREMAAAGQLANDLRYFGIDSPRGSRWYNFNPCGFLECAARYSFNDGSDEFGPVEAISWEQFRVFLGAGQEYE
jgi:hypothetical protein